MFNLILEEGDHKVFNYDTKIHLFREYFENLYETKKLDQLHTTQDYVKHLDGSDTQLHKIFYNDIKSNNTFKNLYIEFIKDIYSYFYPKEDFFIYQSFPSVRLQFPDGISIPPHKDSDHLSNHPLGEKNFLIPITEMKDTNTIWVESEEDKKDFKPYHLKYGDLFRFNGNTCTHYNKENKEGKLRISMDFRIMLVEDYLKYVNFANLKKSNPRDLALNRLPTLMLAGGYYQICQRSKEERLFDWVKIENIMQHRPSFGKEEAEACYQYMLEDNFVTEHKKTEELEKVISKYLNCKECIMTTSGTLAITLALMSLDLPEGSEVIVPNYTMIATVNSVKFLKLKPVIIDIDKETATLSLEEIKKHVTEKTSCILHVSLNNRYKDIEEIVDYCRDNNIEIIEDSAQSLGCKINGKNLGTFGKIGCFSLSTPKIISAGQGGFCVTDDLEIARKMRMIKNFGRKESGKDNFEVFGMNFKFTDIQAVICLEQMKKLDWRVKRMRQIYNLYYQNLKDNYEMRKPLSEEWIPWFVDIYLENREELMSFLKKHKINTRAVYGEINKTSVYYSEENLINSQFICSQGLFLPSYVDITDSQINYICNLLILYRSNVL